MPEVSAQDLIPIVVAGLSKSPATAWCLAALMDHPTALFSVGSVSTKSLRRIYRIRAQHLPSDVAGVPELVQALDQFFGERVEAVLIPARDTPTTGGLFVEPGFGELIGAVTGPDRRLMSRDIQQR